VGGWSSELGDFLRAVRLLGAGGNALSRQAIAEALGLDIKSGVDTRVRDSALAAESRAAPKTSSVVTHREIPPRTNVIPSELRYLDAVSASEQPRWLAETRALDAPSPHSRVIPAKASLLAPSWSRALIITALSTIWESGEIDVAGLISTMSVGAAIEQLPLLRVATLSLGVHCWIDNGPAMELFSQDQGHVLRGLLNVAGASRVSVRKFIGTPDREGSFVRGAPHLVLTDLGKTVLPRGVSGEPTRDEDWIQFARWVKQDLGARAVVLTPQSPRKLPVALRKELLILSWDRRTSVQTARRAIAGVV
jgi:hypothetical protein